MKDGVIVREKCPVCDSISSKSIFYRNFGEKLIKEYMNVAYQGNADIGFLEGVKYEIVKCLGCNLSYQKYVLDEGKLNELYNKWIDPQLAKEWNEIGKTEKTRVNTFILNFARDFIKREPAKIKILDYGAGFGDSLLIAKDIGFDPYAYEYSTERIHYLEEKGIKVVGDNNEMLFNFIIVNQVLEHLTYPKQILKVIISRLKKDGLIYIEVPNCSHVEKNLEITNNITDANELHRILLNASVPAFQHINFFSNHNLKLLFRKCDVKPLSPYKQAFIKPLSVKSILRPFYRHYFSTGLFLIKAEKL